MYLKHEYPILVGNAAFRTWCVHRRVLGFEQACIWTANTPRETAGVLPLLFSQIEILRGVTACCSLFYDIKSYCRCLSALAVIYFSCTLLFPVRVSIA